MEKTSYARQALPFVVVLVLRFAVIVRGLDEGIFYFEPRHEQIYSASLIFAFGIAALEVLVSNFTFVLADLHSQRTGSLLPLYAHTFTALMAVEILKTTVVYFLLGSMLFGFFAVPQGLEITAYSYLYLAGCLVGVAGTIGTFMYLYIGKSGERNAA